MTLKAEQAGQLLREGAATGPSDAQRLAQRERLIRAVPRPRRRAALWWSLGGLSVAAAMVLLAIFVVLPRLPDTTERIAAAAPPRVEPLAIAFKDGSRVDLAEGARGHVATNGPEAVEVVLESGHLDASVEPRTKRQWTVHAGPFEVVVVGTVFAVDWDAATEELTVEVSRGEVLVRGGPSLSKQGVAVAAGKRLRASVTGKTVTISESDAAAVAIATTPEAPVIDESSEASDPPPPDTKARGGKGRRGVKSPPVPTWDAEAKAGNYAEALRLAKAKGFDRLVEELGAADLGRLAETARLGKDRSRAKLAYEAARRRFPKTKLAARAAFELGRIAARGPKGQRRAIALFRAYLAEQPTGAFVRETQGRLLQSLHAVGDDKAARAVAKRYLQRYPEGPHAKLAKSIAAD